MNTKSVARQLARLAQGDSRAWSYLPYQLWKTLHRLDLGWVSAAESGLSEQLCSWHTNSGGPDLEELLKQLEVKPTDSVLDIGCGKGGAMLTLSKYFQKVDGVEISRNLARIACDNLRRAHTVNARVFCCDAADFHDLDDYTYLYMYNPFPDSTVQLVMHNINRSLRRQPRPLTLIYKNPVFNPVVCSKGFVKVYETDQTDPNYPPFAIYRHSDPHFADRSLPSSL